MPGRAAAPIGDALDGGAPPDPDAGAAVPATDAAAPPVDPDAGAASDPAAIRAAQLVFERRAQKALNDGAPLPAASMTGGHETLITDYEVTNVPGYGTIPVGFAASEAQKKAALQGTITFFRTKNSWGTHPTGFLEPLAGYNDLDVAYLGNPVDVCPDAPGAGTPDSGMPIGTPAVTGCTSFAPLVIDVGLPPGY